MNIDGEKIKQLIEIYGETKGYAKKSHLSLFCDDHDLNYKQWTAYCRNTQKLGLKIIYDLITIFPDLNLNWLFKDQGEILINIQSDSHKLPSEIQ